MRHHVGLTTTRIGTPVCLALCAVLALAIWAYWPVHAYWWIYDDPNWQPLMHFKNWRDWPKAPFVLVNRLSGNDPRTAHLFVLACHLVNAGLLFAFIRHWLTPFAALLAVTLFALHPLQSEAVAYISGGIEVLLGSYVLAALLLGPRWGSPFACLAVMMKPSASPLALAIPMGWLWMCYSRSGAISV